MTPKSSFYLLPFLFSAVLAMSEPSEQQLYIRSSSSARVKPVLPGEVQQDPAILKISAGRTVKLHCRVRGLHKNRNKTVKWYKDGAEISPSTFRRFGKEYRFTKYRQRIEIEDAGEADTGNYSCYEVRTLANSTGTFSLSDLKRQYSVEIVQRAYGMKPIIKDNQPGNVTAFEGQDVKLKCELMFVSVTSPPQIDWLRHFMVNGSWSDEKGNLHVEVLQSCTANGLCGNGTYFVDNPEVMVLKNVSRSDEGYYSCSASNAMGSSHSTGWLSVVNLNTGKHFSSPLPLEDFVISEQLEGFETTASTSLSRGGVSAELTYGVVIGIVLLMLVAVVIVTWRKWRSEKQKKSYAAEAFLTVYKWTKVVLVERDEKELVPQVKIEKQMCQTSKFESLEDFESDYCYSYDPDWEINRDLISFEDVLGEGEFGRVMLAEMKGNYVAVKMLKEGHADQDVVNLVKEMEIMKAIGSHRNIINLLGVCSQPMGKPLYLVVEYAKLKNLRDYLINLRPPKNSDYIHPKSLDVKDMLQMGYQVAQGMSFLASHKCVHRDLAARNILVTEDRVLKIADFGLARNVKATNYYRKVTDGKLPVKWMAPEAIFQRLYTVKSDVWSFGILLWEIFTLGEPPYKNVSWPDLCDWLKSGERLSRPSDCPPQVYQVMHNCWLYFPNERPSWTDLVDQLRNLYMEAQPLDYLDLSSVPKKAQEEP